MKNKSLAMKSPAVQQPVNLSLRGLNALKRGQQRHLTIEQGEIVMVPSSSAQNMNAGNARGNNSTRVIQRSVQK